jgi:hypothetical protein
MESVNSNSRGVEHTRTLVELKTAPGPLCENTLIAALIPLIFNNEFHALRSTEHRQNAIDRVRFDL